MPLRPLPSPGDTAEELFARIKPHLTSVITIRATGGALGTYDPVAGTRSPSGTAAALLESRAARGRRLGAAKETVASEDWRTTNLWRWTIIRKDGDPVIPDGATLIVNDPGKAPLPAGARMKVLEAVGDTESPLVFIVGKVE